MESRIQIIVELLYGIIAIAFYALPTSPIIKLPILCLIFPTTLIKLKANQSKDEKWRYLSQFWSGFLGPLARFVFATIGVLALLPIETIGYYVLAVYVAVLPFVLWILMKWFKATFKEMLEAENIRPFIRR